MKPRRTQARWAAAVGAAVALPACGGGGGGGHPVVERDTAGDTVIVRTVAGSVWPGPARLEPETRLGSFQGEDVYMLGEVRGLAVDRDGAIYLFDRQVPALRKYDREGRFLATFGREGGGPGEYQQSDGGLAVLQDGRVLLRDPGGSRVNLYAPDGTALGQWPLRGGWFTSRPIYTDTAGNAYLLIWGRNEEGANYSALRRYDPAGVPGDSLLTPDYGYEAPTITASTDRWVMSNHVPFSPTTPWTFSPYGYFVAGIGDRYAVDLHQPDGTVLRIERVVRPVAVQPDEKRSARDQAMARFRRVQPDWTWNGPDIPDVKPAYTDLAVGLDGRIWVERAAPGERIPAEELTPPDDPLAPPPDRWREPVLFDVFEPDGTYLGEVRAPRGFQTSPEPVFTRDRIWAVVADALGVEYVTRFRLVVPGSAETD